MNLEFYPVVELKFTIIHKLVIHIVTVPNIKIKILVNEFKR
jgi:hypothetical protein